MKIFLLAILGCFLLTSHVNAALNKRDRVLKRKSSKDKSSKDDRGESPDRCDPAMNAPGLPYCPAQSDMNAFLDAINAWPGFNGDAGLIGTRSLFAVDEPDAEPAQFCLNGDCTVGLDNIINFLVGLGNLLGPPFYYEVYDWISAPGMIYFTDTIEVINSAGGCEFAGNVPRLIYYNSEGKITQIHTTAVPSAPVNEWLKNTFQGTQCN